MIAVHWQVQTSESVDRTIEPRDDELIRSYQSGDASAFAFLVDRHERQILRIAARFSASPEDAKDIYQEVFYRVYKGLHGFRFQSEFTTWLYRITANVCVTHRTIRAKHTHVPIDLVAGKAADPSFPAAGGAESDILRRHEIKRRIERALNALSPKQKLAFTLKHYEGLKIREIAEFMGCGEGTIKRYLFTAMDSMRCQLKDIAEG
jgi:RNA polymerase sigma-70 factor, ECF subfamily